MSDLYDALLLVSFGGPEGPDDVIPFLENVLRGKNVPRERMMEVAEHYQQFGGVSPINRQNRELIAALRIELDAHGINLPIYWGNRNWHPMLSDAVRQMQRDGIRRALAIFTSAYSSYSSCRQYLENVADARAQAGPDAPQIDKLRACFNHPGFIETVADNVATALASIPAERRSAAELLFSAHSIPLAMASGCTYEAELRETCRLVAERVGHTRWRLVFQSRSGPPSQPWLEPDICDLIRELHAKSAAESSVESNSESKVCDVVVSPVGFLSDHIEVLFDLDTAARETCQELGINFSRAATPGTHPRFIRMLREMIDERLSGDSSRAVCGVLPARPDVCPADCCPSGRPASTTARGPKA